MLKRPAVFHRRLCMHITLVVWFSLVSSRLAGGWFLIICVKKKSWHDQKERLFACSSKK